MVPTLLYNPKCSYCPDIITQCTRYFTKKRIQLLVRKPYEHELKRIPGTPALFIPKETFNLDQPLLIVGTEIPTWLQELDEQING